MVLSVLASLGLLTKLAELCPRGNVLTYFDLRFCVKKYFFLFSLQVQTLPSSWPRPNRRNSSARSRCCTPPSCLSVRLIEYPKENQCLSELNNAGFVYCFGSIWNRRRRRGQMFTRKVYLFFKFTSPFCLDNPLTFRGLHRTSILGVQTFTELITGLKFEVRSVAGRNRSKVTTLYLPRFGVRKGTEFGT